MTIGDHIVRNSLAHTLVKHKVFANKLQRQPLFFCLTRILDNAAFHVIDVLEAVMQHIGTGFFTADAAGAVHDNIFVFIVLQHLNRHRQLVAESV
ncbi:hypothetical protein D3C72_2067660 [compost metagenome]